MIQFGETRAFYPVGPRVDGLHRVALLGDSMTYGAAVVPAETLACHLERTLNAAVLGRFFEVVNLGRNGSNFWNAWSSFEHHFADRDFDAAVLNICHNDTELFENNQVRYSEGPWAGTFQFDFFAATLPRVKEFAERRGILFILDFYSIEANDRARVMDAKVASGAAGVCFVDLLSFITEQIADPLVQGIASPIDTHPSGSTHRLAARRLTEEIVASGRFPEPETPVDITAEIARIGSSMRAHGRPREEILKWSVGTLDSKVAAWRRRPGKRKSVNLGEEPGLRARLAAEGQDWHRRLALWAWYESLSLDERDVTWKGLNDYSEWLTALDETLYCLQGDPNETQIAAMNALFANSHYYQSKRRQLRRQSVARLTAARARLIGILSALDECQRGSTLGDELPEFVTLFMAQGELVSRHYDRFLALPDVASGNFRSDSIVSLLMHPLTGGSSLDDDRRLELLRYCAWGLERCGLWIHRYARLFEDVLARAADATLFYTDIDVVVQCRDGSDAVDPRTAIYVAVDYAFPRRPRFTERQVCAVEKKRWAFHFEMPFFVVGDVSVFVPEWVPHRDRFESGKNNISEIRIANRKSGRTVRAGSGVYWSAGNAPSGALVRLPAVRP